MAIAAQEGNNAVELDDDMDLEDGGGSLNRPSSTSSSSMTTTTRLTDLEVLEIELRLLEEEIQELRILQTQEDDDNDDEEPSSTESSQRRIQSLQAIIEALKEEYETMIQVQRHKTAEDLD